jgi:hypothetical protein
LLPACFPRKKAQKLTLPTWAPADEEKIYSIRTAFRQHPQSSSEDFSAFDRDSQRQL